MSIGIPLAIRETANSDNPTRLLYSSIADACVLSCLRTYGQRTTADIEHAFGLQQHALFLTRITSEIASAAMSVAERCAQAQANIDVAQGRVPTIQKDSLGRVWLSYKRSGHWLGKGLICPAASPAVLDASIGQAWYCSRHGQTAAEIGGSSVMFVHTHDMTAGDAFDAGYFVDSGQNKQSHYLWQPQELPSTANINVASALVELDVESPFATLALRMTVLAQMLSITGAVAVTEHAWRIVLGAYWSWLPRAVDMGEITSPKEAALLYGAIVGYDGAAVGLEVKDNCVLVQHDSGCWEHYGVPRQLVDGIVRAWSAILPNFCWQLRAIVVSDASDALQTVRFDLLGPEG